MSAAYSHQQVLAPRPLDSAAVTAGAGPYDFKLIWSNLQLFKEGIISNLGSLDYV